LRQWRLRQQQRQRDRQQQRQEHQVNCGRGRQGPAQTSQAAASITCPQAAAGCPQGCP
jgi:hypothetical protein